jgi:hypothetical protein
VDLYLHSANTPSWRGAQLKHRDNFTLHYRNSAAVAIRKMTSTFNTDFGKPEGKRLLGRPTSRLGDNIRMDFREIGREDVHWMNLSQDRVSWRTLVKTVMNIRVP